MDINGHHKNIAELFRYLYALHEQTFDVELCNEKGTFDAFDLDCDSKALAENMEFLTRALCGHFKRGSAEISNSVHINHDDQK